MWRFEAEVIKDRFGDEGVINDRDDLHAATTLIAKSAGTVWTCP